MGWLKKKEQHSGFMGDLSEKQEECLQEFKEIIQNENLTSDPRYDDYYLLRFLRARKFNMDKTLEMFKKFLEWRVKHQADDAIALNKCPNINKIKEFYKFGYHGTDKEGRPFSIDKPCSFDIDDVLNVATKEELYAFYVEEYETTVHIRLPAASAAAGKKIEQTFNCISIKGFTMRKLREKSREIIKLAISIGQDNYPEIMGKMLIVDSPLLFRGAWGLISPFIDAKTRKKISILGGKYQKELFKYVDPENVPSDMGGECTCDHDENGCYFSHKGPWNEYPADEFGEAAKAKLLEKKEKEEEKSFSSDSESEVEGALPIKINQEVGASMVEIELEGSKAEFESPVQEIEEAEDERRSKKSLFCCGRGKAKAKN